MKPGWITLGPDTTRQRRDDSRARIRSSSLQSASFNRSGARTFVYDSLKGLLTATNPESGTINYQYDNNGNLTQKTDARGVIATYAYDALNRNISVTYTNDPTNTPTVTRTYDGATNGKGKLWKTETSGAAGSRTTINSFDALGRPTSQSQQFYANSAWSQPFTVSAAYDKAGHLLTQTYPTHLHNILGSICHYLKAASGHICGGAGRVQRGRRILT